MSGCNMNVVPLDLPPLAAPILTLELRPTARMVLVPWLCEDLARAEPRKGIATRRQPTADAILLRLDAELELAG